MSGVNKVILVGRLGKDPELRKTAGGQNVCSATLATSEKRKSGEEVTEWHNLVIWNDQAKTIAQYCTKGSQLYVEGKLQTRSWDDDNGNKHYKTEIVVFNFQFLGGGNKNNQQGNSANQQHQNQYATFPQQNTQSNPMIENDLPF